MAVTLSGNISLLASLVDQRTAVSGAALESGQRLASLTGSYPLVSGTGAGQVDKLWTDTRVVTTGATDSLDLAGVLTDSFGATVTFAKIRGILIAAAAGNTTTLQIARPAANGVPLFAAASDALAALSAGGFFCWVDPAAGVAVTAGTGDLLSIINSAGASATYSIAIIGTSA